MLLTGGNEFVIKNDIYLFDIIFYNGSITDIEHSPNYTTFGLLQTHQEK